MWVGGVGEFRSPDGYTQPVEAPREPKPWGWARDGDEDAKAPSGAA